MQSNPYHEDDIAAPLRSISHREQACIDLDDVRPFLTELLSVHWSTGQGTRVRHILWSLYNCDHLVNLGDACSGLDRSIADAIQKLVTARLVAGPDAECIFGQILKESGEFHRYEQMEKITPGSCWVNYPPNSASPEELRNMARAAEEMPRSSIRQRLH